MNTCSIPLFLVSSELTNASLTSWGTDSSLGMKGNTWRSQFAFWPRDLSDPNKSNSLRARISSWRYQERKSLRRCYEQEHTRPWIY